MGRIILPLFCPMCCNTLFNKGLLLDKVVSKRCLKLSSSTDMGDLIRDILSIRYYLSTKIVIKHLIRYFFVLLPFKKG